MLENVTSAALTSDESTLPNPVPMVTASWQVVEGVKVGEEEGEFGQLVKQEQAFMMKVVSSSVAGQSAAFS